MAGCASGDRRAMTAPDTVDVTVMTFNVENLFDNVDDPGKDDKAYLPLAAKQNQSHIDECNQIKVPRFRDECLNLDWDEATLDHKLTVVAQTIRQVNGGRGADIIALQEVENLAVLERLRTEYLGDLDYMPGILVEGSDLRGIDLAFLSRLPLAQPPRLHPFELPAEFANRAGDTRGVLEATFELPDGSLLSGFSVHFPAPYHPTEMRIAAYDHLNSLLAALPEHHHAFAAGDFNTTSSEDTEQQMLDRYARPKWTVAHDLGCGPCKGTYYYARDDNWSFLDLILFATGRGAETTAQIRAGSIQIANRIPTQVTANQTPQGFNATARRGVSDHWPMIATIEVAQKQ